MMCFRLYVLLLPKLSSQCCSNRPGILGSNTEIPPLYDISVLSFQASLKQKYRKWRFCINDNSFPILSMSRWQNPTMRRSRKSRSMQTLWDRSAPQECCCIENKMYKSSFAPGFMWLCRHLLKENTKLRIVPISWELSSPLDCWCDWVNLWQLL